MLRITAICAILLLALACQAFAVTAVIDSFDGGYFNYAIGQMPNGWTAGGYGPPAHSSIESGIVTSGTATRWDVPGTAGNPKGTIYIYKAGFSIDDAVAAVGGPVVDWSKPVYLKVDVYGNDLGTDTMFRQKLDYMNYGNVATDWGNNGATNQTWQTLSVAVDPFAQGEKAYLLFWLDFDFTNKTFEGTDTAIWDNLRIEYSTVPEPSSLIALFSGVAGLGGLIIRRKK